MLTRREAEVQSEVTYAHAPTDPATTHGQRPHGVAGALRVRRLRRRLSAAAYDRPRRSASGAGDPRVRDDRHQHPPATLGTAIPGLLGPWMASRAEHPERGGFRRASREVVRAA